MLQARFGTGGTGQGQRVGFTMLGTSAVLRGTRAVVGTFPAGSPLALALANAMVESGRAVRDTARELVKRDTNRLANSIRVTLPIVRANGTLEIRVGPTVAYGAAVEYGRAADKPWPPERPILRWLQRHGVPEPDFVDVVRVRRKIGRKGIKAAPYMRPALALEKGRLLTRLHAALGKAVVLELQG